MKISHNRCTVCQEGLTKVQLSEDQRATLCTSIDLMASMLDMELIDHKIWMI